MRGEGIEREYGEKQRPANCKWKKHDRQRRTQQANEAKDGQCANQEQQHDSNGLLDCETAWFFDLRKGGGTLRLRGTHLLRFRGDRPAQLFLSRGGAFDAWIVVESPFATHLDTKVLEQLSSGKEALAQVRGGEHCVRLSMGSVCQRLLR